MSGLTAKIQLLRLEIEHMIDRLDSPDPGPHSQWFCNQPLHHVPGRLIPPPICPDRDLESPQTPAPPSLLSRLSRWVNPPPPPFDEDAWRYFHPDTSNPTSPTPWSAVPTRRRPRALSGKITLCIIGPPSALNESAADAPCRLPTNLILDNPATLQSLTTAKLLQRRYNIAHYVSALPALPAEWTRHFPLLDEIWTPSQFSRAALQATTTLPVHVIPFPVDALEQFATLAPADLDLPRGPFIFSSIFDLAGTTTIHNPLALLHSFQQEFGTSSDVFLVLKCRNSQSDPEQLAELRQRTSAPNIRLIDAPFTKQHLHSLLKFTDCFVSPHRGEGFGHDLAAAMYFGKAVVATRFGANTEFMDDANSYLVDYRLAEAGRAVGGYPAGAVCADVDRADLARQMRRAFQDQTERRLKGEAAALTIRDHFSAQHVRGLIRQRLAEVERPAAVHPAWPHPFLPQTTPSQARTAIHQLRTPPRISVITPVYNVDPRWLLRCVDSVRAQWYPNWELCLCDDGSTSDATLAALESYRGVDPRIRVIRESANRGIAAASNRAAEFATGEYLAMLDNDDELSPDALFEVARALERAPELDLLYTDEDKIDEQGRHVDHYHKPDWSPEHLQSVMYILHMLVVRKSIFLELGGFREQFSGAQDYDLALRVTSISQRVGHIPKVLYHWRKIEGSAALQVDAKPKALEAGRRALEDFVRVNGLPARVEPGLLPGLFRVKYRVVGKPKVTLLIISGVKQADLPGRGRVVMVEHFVESLILKTEYRNYEIAVSHDPDITPSTAENLARLGCRLLPYPKPPGRFNFSHKSNWSLGQVHTEHVIILNDDLEVISGEWLSSMLEYSQQPWVGAVGARLLYADGNLQHGGMALGVNDGAAHLYHQHSAALVGYNAFTHLVRNYSILTAAVLATRMSVVEKIGGFDETFAMDYNDVDFCMKLIDRGYRVVYTPYSELYHFEGQVMIRSAQLSREAARFVAKWRPWVEADPHYNVNLTRHSLDFGLRRE